MSMSGADIVLECLERAGIDTVFGYPGGVVLPLYDRWPSHPGVRHILVRHEQGGGHAADGYARASGRLGCALATSGPGATNLVTAIQNAMMDSVPTLFVTGNVARNLIGKDGFQEADATGITTPCVKHNYLVMHTEHLAPTFAEAAYLATTGRPGPVHIDIPKDVFIDEAEFEWPERVSVRGYRVPGAADPADIEAAARLIDEAERPLIIAGHGVILGNACDELLAFAEHTGIPVLNTLLGLGSIPRTHVLSVGMMGMHGSYEANMAASGADLVIGVGNRMDDRAIGRFADFNREAKLIHVDIDPGEHGKNLPTAVPILGDAKQALAQLTAATRRRTHAGWVRWIDETRAAHAHSMAIPGGAELTAQGVIRRISERVGDDAIIVTGVGQHQMWAAQHMRFARPRQLITSGGLGTMGFEVPAAMGAQVARPGAPVWSICGDGGFQMTSQELATMVDERLPVKMAIVNNGYLGMVRQWQELFYEDNYVAVAISQPDFVQLAAAYGVRGLRVTGPGEVDAAIDAANAHDGPVVVDFRVEAEANVWPMVPAGAALSETVEAPQPEPASGVTA